MSDDTATVAKLRELMRSRYDATHLPNLEIQIRGLIGVEDAQNEGYEDASVQRDQSVKFTWGHNQDFGTFKVDGLMGDRHLKIVAEFVDAGVLPVDLADKTVLDIGCWTGGASLLLSAMGAKRVWAFEEVNKYARAAAMLATAFEVGSLSVSSMSLYDLPCLSGTVFPTDYALLSGVLYHVSDPLLAMRICFNALRDGGSLLVETAIVLGDERAVVYCGPTRTMGDAASLTRQGWNWFVASEKAWAQMLRDVGFASVHSFTRDSAPGRAFLVAKRDKHRDMLRAGFSGRGVA